MAYTPTYTSDDVAPVVVDSGTKVIVGIATFATILGLLLGIGIGVAVYKWATKR